MKIGILITARLGSKRLNDKHLKLVNEQPVISFLIDRIKSEFDQEIKSGNVEIVISSTQEERNIPLITLAKTLSIEFFGGSVENIPLRHYENAQKYGLNGIISIDGDDILCSPEAMRKVYEEFKTQTGYIKVNGLPLGMNCSGYSTALLGECLERFKDEQLETGWGRLFEGIESIDIEMGDHDIYNSEKRFTLDYEEDFHFFKNIIENFGERIHQVSSDDIVDYCEKNSIYNINSGRAKEYWDNFFKELNDQQG